MIYIHKLESIWNLKIQWKHKYIKKEKRKLTENGIKTESKHETRIAHCEISIQSHTVCQTKGQEFISNSNRFYQLPLMLFFMNTFLVCSAIYFRKSNNKKTRWTKKYWMNIWVTLEQSNSFCTSKNRLPILQSLLLQNDVMWQFYRCLKTVTQYLYEYILP